MGEGEERKSTGQQRKNLVTRGGEWVAQRDGPASLVLPSLLQCLVEYCSPQVRS